MTPNRKPQTPQPERLTPAQVAERRAAREHPALTVVPDLSDDVIVEDPDSGDTAGEIVVLDGSTSTGNDLVVVRTAEQYLTKPLGRDGNPVQWKPRTTAAGKTGAASAAGMSDNWKATRATPAPATLVSRMARTAQIAVRDGRDPLLVVKSAMGVPVIATAFENAWVARYGEPPMEKDTRTVIFEAFDLLSQGFGWSQILAAVQKAADDGHVFVQRAYRELVTAGRRLDRRDPLAEALEQARRIDMERGTAR